MAEEGCSIKKGLEEQAHPRCAGLWEEYEACGKRIESDTTGEANCKGQYFEYFACVDKLVAPELFRKLK